MNKRLIAYKSHVEMLVSKYGVEQVRSVMKSNLEGKLTERALNGNKAAVREILETLEENVESDEPFQTAVLEACQNAFSCYDLIFTKKRNRSSEKKEFVYNQPFPIEPLECVREILSSKSINKMKKNDIFELVVRSAKSMEEFPGWFESGITPNMDQTTLNSLLVEAQNQDWTLGKQIIMAHLNERNPMACAMDVCLSHMDVST